MSLADDIVRWIRSVVTDAGADGLVIGLSGGIDSAVAGALAARALPGKVLGAILPCESDPRDAHDARLVAARFDIETTEIDLTNAYLTLAAALPDAPALTRANLKPRLRMLVLYYLAASRNALVCGASNRSELAIGYFTKFGDGGVDLMPIGGLLKRQVRELAAALDVPKPVIERPPTAGLWPGQTDEGEMGLTYEQLDAALLALDGDATVAVAPEVVARVRRMIQRSAHKRSLPPIYTPARVP
ncbi:MAG TPA: NAD+ synthase [Planctomycetota bacterium]|nr:NAD+ synthase [Planctomycetota bacterium]HRR80952.1 NAD+ synthase [Planctomycetota bacterium]HRT96220.1 NAD+ synthase [Planctomycetota bacterium]